MDIDRRFNINMLSLMNVRYLLSYYPLSSKDLVEMHAPSHPLEKTTWHHYNGRVADLREGTISWPNVQKGMMFVVERPRPAQDHVYAYRNVCALPRVFSVERAERHGSDSDVLESLTRASTVELLRTAHMSSADAPPVGEKLVPASLRRSSYRAGRLEFDTVSRGEAVIVVADTWLPGWKVYVNGEEARPFRVNHTQIGIHLPAAGTFHIKLAYEPHYRLLTDILAAPTRLLPNASPSEPFDRQFGSGDVHE
jgi:hypothetical protein